MMWIYWSIRSRAVYLQRTRAALLDRRDLSSKASAAVAVLLSGFSFIRSCRALKTYLRSAGGVSASVCVLRFGKGPTAAEQEAI